MAAAVVADQRQRSFVFVVGAMTATTIIILFGVSACSALEERGEESLVSRIAFGSCANQSAPQVNDKRCSTSIIMFPFHFSWFSQILLFLKPIWNAIIDFKPHVFIWLGDNIYGDIRRPFRLFGNERTIGPWKNVPRFTPCSEDEMKSRYILAKNNPGYSRLRRNTKVTATYPAARFYYCYYYHYIILIIIVHPFAACLVHPFFVLCYFLLTSLSFLSFISGYWHLGRSWFWIKWCRQGIRWKNH